MVRHLINAAQARSYRRLSLETGSADRRRGEISVGRPWLHQAL